MSGDLVAARSRARRAYELGMLRLGVQRALAVAALLSALVLAGRLSPPAPWLLALVVGLWVVLGWRGALVWRGALSGLAWGVLSAAMPWSVLRPCCAAMRDATDCSTPSLCAGAGIALGLAIVATLPRGKTAREWALAATGAVLAAGSLVACRCMDLLLGEALGLVTGLLASAASLATARAWWVSREHRAPRPG